jgi:hypothetical protein
VRRMGAIELIRFDSTSHLVPAEFLAMRQHWIWVIAGFAILAVLPGCGPNVSRSDLGTIVYEVPTVAGADEPYKYPDLPRIPLGTKYGRRVPPDASSPPDSPPPPAR